MSSRLTQTADLVPMNAPRAGFVKAPQTNPGFVLGPNPFFSPAGEREFSPGSGEIITAFVSQRGEDGSIEEVLTIRHAPFVPTTALTEDEWNEGVDDGS